MAALDFPNAPVVGQTYSANGVSFQWDGNYWQSNQGAAAGGAVDEAPINGKIYGRQDTFWTETIAKTAYDLDKTAQSTKDNNQDAAINLNTMNIAQKEPLLPAGGTTAQFLRGDKIWAEPAGGSGGAGVTDGDKGDIVVTNSGTTWLFDSGVVTAAAKTVLDDGTVAAMRTTLGAAAVSHQHPQSDITNLQPDLAAKEPLVAPGNAAYFWAGDKTWKSAGGIAEAPTDGQSYTRKGSDASWLVALAPGSTIIEGFAPPASSVGKEDDYYLDSNAHILYGPKSTIGLLPPQSMITNAAPPTSQTGTVAVGNEFKCIAQGEIVGARFYRHASTVGTTRKIHLYNTVGLLLSETESTTAESGAGWVTANFKTPVAVAAGASVIAAVDLSGSYLYDANPPATTNALHATWTTGRATSGSGFPATPSSIDYGVDLIWRPIGGPVWPVAVQSGTVGLPEAPVDGTLYSRRGSDASWQPSPSGGSGGGAATYIGDTPPASPTIGQLWWNSSDGNMSIWYNDGTSNQWVPSNTGVAPIVAAAPLPTATAGVLGNFRSLQSTTGGALSLPAGGTWAWAIIGSNASSGIITVGFQVNVSPGGTQVAAATAGIIFHGFCWRIT